MAKDQVAGVVLSGQTLAWTTGRRGRSGVTSAQHGHTVVSDADVESADDLAIDLAQGGAHLNGQVVLGVATEELLMRVVRLPMLDDEDELLDMVDLQVDKFWPFSSEDVVVGHEVLSTHGDMQNVLIAAAQRSYVERLGEAVREAGGAPCAVDAAALGRWRVLQDAGHVVAEGRAVYYFGDDATSELIVSDNGKPVLFRSLGHPDDVSADECAEDLLFSLTSLEAEHGVLPLTQVSLWGLEDEDVHLAAALSREVSCPVDRHDLADLAPVTDGILRRHLAPSGEQVDLVPEVWRTLAAGKTMRRRLIVVSALALMIWAVGVGWVLWQDAVVDREFEDLKAEFQSVLEPATEVRRVRKQVRSLERISADLVALDSLHAISAALPQDAELQSYTYGADRVSLSGSASTPTAVYDFKAALDTVSSFRSVQLTGPVLRRGRETFRINIELGEVAPLLAANTAAEGETQ